MTAAANTTGMASIAVRFYHDGEALRNGDAIFDDAGSIPVRIVDNRIVLGP